MTEGVRERRIRPSKRWLYHGYNPKLQDGQVLPTWRSRPSSLPPPPPPSSTAWPACTNLHHRRLLAQGLRVPVLPVWVVLSEVKNIFISSDLPPQPAKSQLSPKVLSQLSPPSPKSFWSSHSICSAWNFGPENKIPRLSDIFYRDQDFWISILERKAALRYLFSATFDRFPFSTFDDLLLFTRLLWLFKISNTWFSCCWCWYWGWTTPEETT